MARHYPDCVVTGWLAQTVENEMNTTTRTTRTRIIAGIVVLALVYAAIASWELYYWSDLFFKP